MIRRAFTAAIQTRYTTTNTDKQLEKFDPLHNFEVIDNRLSLGNFKLTELFQQGYTTPLYVYSRKVIEDKIRTLRSLLADTFRIYYSIKANPCRDIVSYLHPYIDGFDVSSVHELNLALDTGIAGGNICYTGPGKSEHELEQAVTSGVMISAESRLEIERIIRLGLHLNVTPKIMLRVNPDFIQHRAGMKMASGSSQFGMDEDLLPDIIGSVENSALQFEGFHIYTGSQILDANAINDAQDNIFRLLDRLANHCAQPVKVINVGGGFGIPYFDTHCVLDINSVCGNLNRLLSEIDQRKFSTDLHTILELGRYIVGEAGVYICKVIDKKISRGKTYLITDGGMHHHLAASGNLGQKVRKNFPLCVADKITSQKMENVTVCGKLCTPLDLLAEDVRLSQCTTGDYIAIMNSGAYGLSASPVNFLSHPIAEEVLL